MNSSDRFNHICKLDRDILVAIGDILEQVQQAADQCSLPHESGGICSNAHVLSNSHPIAAKLAGDMPWVLDDVLTHGAACWPLYSTNKRYPVPCPSDQPYQEANWIYVESARAYSLWVGSYGALRRNLLQFLITLVAQAAHSKGR